MELKVQHCLLAVVLVSVQAASVSKECKLILHPKAEVEQWTFEGNLQRFKKPEVVTEFKKHYQNGLLPKNKEFNMRDPATKQETISVVDLLFFSDSCETMTKLVNWLYPQMNREQLVYAQSVVLLHRKDLNSKPFILPRWYNVFPNYFVPKSVLDKVKKSVEEGTYSADDVPLVTVDEGSEEWSWMTEDTGLSNMFHNWNLHFPAWMDPEKYGLDHEPSEGRGRLMYELNNQLAALYNTYTDPDRKQYVMSWDCKVKPGYGIKLSNSVGLPLASREPMFPHPESDLHGRVKAMEELLNETARTQTVHTSDGKEIKVLSPSEKTVSVLGDLLYGTTESPSPSDMSYYDLAAQYLASIGSNPNKDGGGVVGYTMTALNDPAYFGMVHNVHRLIHNYINYYSESPDSYNNSMVMTDVVLTDCDTSRIETFLEPMTIDVTAAVDPETDAGESKRFTVRKLRLNHKPIRITLKAINNSPAPKKVLISLIVMQKITEKIYAIPSTLPVFDRFVTEVPKGESEIVRNFEDTNIFVDDDNPTVQCGLPRRLALPKGSPGGTAMILYGLVTPYEGPVPPETISGATPLCAGRLANFDRSFGFPADRTVDDDNVLEHRHQAMCQIRVYHEPRDFGNGLIL